MPKFNKQAYLACDTKAKNAIRSYLDSLEGVFTKVFEDYGPDIQSWRQVWHEVEIKSSWENKWPSHWKSVHIPYRKKKYLEKGKVMFWVLNKNCSEAIYIDGKHLVEDYVEVIPNKRYPNGEHFYDIPIHLTKFIDLT